jgi:hypothetical protein
LIAARKQRGGRPAAASGASLIVFALGFVAFAAPVQAAWNQPVGGASPINYSSAQDAAFPDLIEIGGVPYLAWSEDDGNYSQIRVSRLNAAGTAWPEVVGGPGPISVPTDHGSIAPSLTSIGGVPYVAWLGIDFTPPTPNLEIRAARLNAAGTAWEELAGATQINWASMRDADEPSMTAIGGVPYIAWSETTGTRYQIRVARLNAAGTAWEFVGGSQINQDVNRDATTPSLTAIGGVPYVAWVEADGTNREIRVARLNAAATAWEQIVGGASPINHSSVQDAVQPSLTSIGGVPWVAWDEADGVGGGKLRVARANAAGTAWQEVVGGASPINQAFNRNALLPSLTAIGGVPYVAWYESDGTHYQVRVSRLNAAGTAWEQLVGGASPINQAGDQDAVAPSLTSIGGVPYVAWDERDGTNDEIRVSRLEPDFLGPATASATDTSATLSVGVRAFSLPYQVGFDYGPGFGSQSATTQTSGETETVTQTVLGLSPSTSYSFRPFATAGLPRPRVLGGVDAFTTAAPPDTTAPELKLAGKKTQHLGSFVAVKASCPSEACGVEAAGTLIVGSGRAERSERALRRFKLKPASVQLPAGRRATAKLRIAGKVRKAAAKALDQHSKLRAKIVVTATDAVGNPTTGRRTVRLVP